ncbi:SpoVK/Ycf46/Vps4 family AAA+-type ATPase [Rhizobium azooxidifex]|uniref:SpoVK/Ycf46/Vps4 family AAA+-type ATPase n=1 Tax=Mycoplana azooxidifex TaxID=1636188 RepID=A0A7W6DAE5_9HYPH|nr:AAA family ATPase [Mycoplana azooxidifex]MBB3979570.1 SpoVK/Ycf46/Vps4 family AAA+-type ATPase [Mycoplana azooxidifex]
MITKRPISPAHHKPSFPTAVIMCSVRKALRPFLNHPDARFKALLQMPYGFNGESIFFQLAITELMQSEAQYDEYGNDRLFIARLDEISIVNSLRKVFDAKRTVLLCSDLDALDPNIRLIADVEIVLEPPRPAHYLAAAREIGLKDMTREDAEYLAGLDFERVKMAVNEHRTLRSAIGRLRRVEAAQAAKASVRPPQPNKADRTLHEMSGYGEAADWGIQLAEDLAAWQSGKIDWQDVDRGAVLCGRPGTGKTTYGRILAATCGVPIIETSSARWQAKGHLGDMLKAMRQAFELADKHAPCILFIDEFDAFGDRSSDTAGDNLDYKRQVINALLECLDPPAGRPGVVVVAATNFPEAIDSALLRPGRLERLIGIPLPDGAAREAILRQHLRGLTAPDDLRQFREMSAGYAGANIELIARGARRRVRREGRALEEKDLLDALPPSRMLSDAELRRVAIHEAGHALVTLVASPDELLWVVINRRIALDDTGSTLGHVEYRRRQSVCETEDSLMARIGVHMGGIAAERVVFGHHSTSGGGAQNSDLRIATELATAVERQYGFGESLVLDMGSGQRALEDLRARDPRLWRAVDHRLKSSLDKTEAILAEYRDELDVLAAMLMERGSASGAEVRNLLSVSGDRLARPVPGREGSSRWPLRAKPRWELKR